MKKCFCNDGDTHELSVRDGLKVELVPCVDENNEFEGIAIDVLFDDSTYGVSFLPKYCPFCGEKIRDEYSVENLY